MKKNKTTYISERTIGPEKISKEDYQKGKELSDKFNEHNGIFFNRNNITSKQVKELVDKNKNFLDKLGKKISYPLQGPHESNEDYNIRLKEYEKIIDGDNQ
jgi:hypothetical protein